MTRGLQNPATSTTEELLVAKFFRSSVGNWLSERRYYTLPDGATQEVVSEIAI